VDFVHFCAFCGWHRSGHSPTILSPACESCGCALRSTTRAEYEEARAGEAPPAEGLAADHRRLVKAATLGGGAILTAAAAKAGYSEGGAWIALVAFGMAGLAVTSVPQQG
jgi:hypothetical protein